MEFPRVLLFVFTAISWLHMASSQESTCVELAGIVRGGGDGVLDLDVIRVNFPYEVQNLTAPILPVMSSCERSGLETPVNVRHLLAIDAAVFTIFSMFHKSTTGLDVFGDKETSNLRRRCYPGKEDTELFDLHRRVAITYAFVHQGLALRPSCREEVEPYMVDAGLDLSLMDVANDTDTPWGLAKAYGEEIISYLNENDGWNADGSANRKFNRIPYSDYEITDSAGNSWTPYTPKNNPWKLKHPRRWQPLMESDGLGYFSTQEHVTPHIGVTGRFFGFFSSEDEESFASRQLDDPKYRNKKASRDVLEESRLTATDDFKQAAVSFYDEKRASLNRLKTVYFNLPTTPHDPTEFYMVTFAAQLAIYNSVLLSWREKIRHDLPRPPTVITHLLGDEILETYAGPEQGVQSIKASEWEPFIRTMPHSEFPSASACICEAFIQLTVEYLGTDELDPPVTVVAFDYPFEYHKWSDISRDCGDSRVWGGMHFAEAVPAGAELCGGKEMAVSILSSLGGLLEGNEMAAVFKRDVGELKVRPL